MDRWIHGQATKTRSLLTTWETKPLTEITEIPEESERLVNDAVTCR
jgi:hypothetical protein